MKFLILLSLVISCFLVQANSEELKRKMVTAVYNQNIEEIKKLKEAGVDINAAIETHGLTALHLASNMNDYELVQKLRALGADPLAKAEGGIIPLHMTGNLDIIKTYVLDDKVDPNIEDDLGNTIVHSPYLKGVETMRFLKEAGADLKKKNKYGATSLHASKRGPEVIDYLVENGVDVHAQITEGEFEGFTALHLQTGGAETERLLRAGADVNAETKEGYTPLHSNSPDPEKTRLLVAAGGDVHARGGKEGNTPLHMAAMNSYHKRIEILLEAEADPNARNEHGETPLHTLTGRADPKIAEALIKGGADPRLKDKNGKLPYVVRKNPRLLFLSNKIRKKSETYCRYLNNSSQIEAVQCGRRSICMAEVSCSLNIGIGSNRDMIGRQFHAVCSSLSNGKCPEAVDCVLDRSVMEKKTKTEKPSSGPSKPKTSSKGVR